MLCLTLYLATLQAMVAAPQFTPRPGFPALEGAPSPDGVRCWADGEMDPRHGWIPAEKEWFLS